MPSARKNSTWWRPAAIPLFLGDERSSWGEEGEMGEERTSCLSTLEQSSHVLSVSLCSKQQKTPERDRANAAFQYHLCFTQSFLPFPLPRQDHRTRLARLALLVLEFGLAFRVPTRKAQTASAKADCRWSFWTGPASDGGHGHTRFFSFVFCDEGHGRTFDSPLTWSVRKKTRLHRFQFSIEQFKCHCYTGYLT